MSITDDIPHHKPGKDFPILSLIYTNKYIYAIFTRIFLKHSGKFIILLIFLESFHDLPPGGKNYPVILKIFLYNRIRE